MEYLIKVRQQVVAGLQQTPFVSQGLQGHPKREHYVRYLTNVWHYAQHSACVIGMAGANCVRRQHTELADYLLHHAREELGHEQWALDDLRALGEDPSEVVHTRPVPACAAMVGFEYYTAMHANPVGLFGWLYVLEAIGDDLGHIFGDRMAEAFDAPDCVKFLKGHGDADEQHTRDLTQQITNNVRDADRPDMYHVADVIADLYVRMFREIGD